MRKAAISRGERIEWHDPPSLRQESNLSRTPKYKGTTTTNSTMVLPTVAAVVRSNNNKKALRLRKAMQLTFMSMVAFVIGFLMSYDEAMKDNSMSDIETRSMMMKEEGNPLSILDHSSADGTTASSATIPSTTLELLGTISMKQKQLYHTILVPEYGRFASLLFNTQGLERIFQLSPLSKKRLIRKLIVKILQGRMHNSNTGKGSNSDESDEDNKEPIFQWVTAGDSAAAGHGNSYEDSYTSVLQDTTKDLFYSAAGIRFTATNRAGDAWSGMEVALCMRSIFGKEVDVLSWDFMPTTMMNSASSSTASSAGYYGDPMGPSRGLDPLLFGERAGRVFPHLPFLFFLGPSSSNKYGGARADIRKLETSGMGTNIMNVEELKELVATSFPNYNNEEKGRNGVRAVNGLRCGPSVDGKELCSDPTTLFHCIPKIGAHCAAIKYDNNAKDDESSCNIHDDERYQTPWNDGWRMHKLKGRLLGFHMVEMLRLAAIELDVLERTHPKFRIDPSQAVEVLRAEEEVEEFLFSKTQTSGLFDDEEGRNGALDSWNVLKQKNSVCLNAKAASMAPHSHSHEKMVDNLPQYQLDPPSQELCQDSLPFQNVYFRLSREDGWVSIDPLATSRRIISQSELRRSGVALGLCFKNCHANDNHPQCSENDAQNTSIDWTKVEIRVNDNPVAVMKEVGGCFHVLQDEKDAARNTYYGAKIRNRGDVVLLLSSAFILF